ncbi:MAG: hypothetical protein ACR2O3_15365 [Rhizobiaceae bacterium]
MLTFYDGNMPKSDALSKEKQRPVYVFLAKCMIFLVYYSHGEPNGVQNSDNAEVRFGSQSGGYFNGKLLSTPLKVV